MRVGNWQAAGGLNCIACHTFQLKPAKTMPAIDLTVMADRLQKRWFYHYLRNPQRFHPGTVMPSLLAGRASDAERCFGGESRSFKSKPCGSIFWRVAKRERRAD